MHWRVRSSCGSAQMIVGGKKAAAAIERNGSSGAGGRWRRQGAQAATAATAASRGRGEEETHEAVMVAVV